jgi:hypothetical protein
LGDRDLKREGLLAKVIFIMPPRTKGELDTKERWEAARQALASHGLEAPEHQRGCSSKLDLTAR